MVNTFRMKKKVSFNLYSIPQESSEHFFLDSVSIILWKSMVFKES